MHPDPKMFFLTPQAFFFFFFFFFRNQDSDDEEDDINCDGAVESGVGVVAFRRCLVRFLKHLPPKDGMLYGWFLP